MLALVWLQIHYIYVWRAHIYIYSRCACDSVLPYNLSLHIYIYIHTPLRFHHAVQFQAQAFSCGTSGCRALSRLRINHPPVITIFYRWDFNHSQRMVYDKFRTLFYPHIRGIWIDTRISTGRYSYSMDTGTIFHHIYIYIYMNDVRSVDTGTTLNHGWEIPSFERFPFTSWWSDSHRFPPCGGACHSSLWSSHQQNNPPTAAMSCVFFRVTQRWQRSQLFFRRDFRGSVNQAPDVGSTKGPAGFEPNVCWSNF